MNVNGQTYTRVYSASTRTFTTTSPLGRATTATIDVRGRVVQSQDGNLLPVALTYDARGRLATATQGSGSSARTTTFAYDSFGNLASVTDPLQRVIGFTYDANGRPLQKVLPDGQAIAVGYDPNGNATALTPPGRPAHAFGYTSLDLPASYTPPDVSIGNTTTSYSYNLDHQVSEVTRPDGLKIDPAYDSAGRIGTITIPTGQLGFGYDPKTGNLATISAPSGVALSDTFDGLLPTGETWAGPVAGSMTEVYDRGFQLTSQSLNGTALTFQRDGDGLLTQAGSLAVQRDSTTGLVTGSSLGTVTDTIGYDGFGQVASYSASAGSTPIFSVQFTRDNLGRITQRTETIGGTTDTYAYSYDQRGRLVQVQKDGTTISAYTYDANGNRLSFTGPAGTVAGTYDAQDRMTAYRTTTYAYTANGELQSATTGGQTTTDQYDVLGNLLGVTLPNGTRISYVVDGKNRRVGKKVNGTLAQGFLYQDGLRPLAELDGSGNLVSRFVYGPQTDVPDYLVKGGNTYRIVADPRGSPRLVVNVATGQVVQRLDYDEFGNVLQDTNPGFQPFGFAGGLYDRDTGLVRAGARDFDSRSGRWTTRDPLTFNAGDTNLYAYVQNDPIDLVDPDGLAATCVRSGNSIFITLKIGYLGFADASAKVWFNINIRDTWTGSFGKYDVYTTVEDGFDNFVWVWPGAGRATVGDSWYGEWYHNQPDRTAAHEAGHLMGLPDRYTDAGGPDPGWENDIMANHDKDPPEADIEQIISICGCKELGLGLGTIEIKSSGP